MEKMKRTYYAPCARIISVTTFHNLCDTSGGSSAVTTFSLPKNDVDNEYGDGVW